MLIKKMASALILSSIFTSAAFAGGGWRYEPGRDYQLESSQMTVSAIIGLTVIASVADGINYYENQKMNSQEVQAIIAQELGEQYQEFMRDMNECLLPGKLNKYLRKSTPMTAKAIETYRQKFNQVCM